MTYLSIHIFPKPGESLDYLISRWLGLFVQKLHEAQPGFKKYFFIRSVEGGEHLRLRVRGSAAFFEETVTPLVAEVFEKEAGAALAVVPYVPEVERFGGAAGYLASEEYFGASSAAAFSLVSEARGEYEVKMGDALLLHIGVAVAAGFTRREAAAYFAGLARDWLPVLCRPETAFQNGEAEAYFAAIEGGMQAAFEKQEETSRRAVSDFWEQFEQVEGDVFLSNWLKINQLLLPEIPPSAWPDLMHLTNNRLGIANQDEVFLFHLLGKVL